MLGTTKAQTRLHCLHPSSVDPSKANYSIASQHLSEHQNYKMELQFMEFTLAVIYKTDCLRMM